MNGYIPPMASSKIGTKDACANCIFMYSALTDCGGDRKP